MSAWRIGTESTKPVNPQQTFRARGTRSTSGKEKTEQVGDWVTKWIPSDALAFYLTGVTALAAQSHSKPSPLFLCVTLVLTFLLVIGGAWASGSRLSRATWVSALLGVLAFAIWSLTVPFSGWQSWSIVARNQVGTAIGAAVAGILFALFAEGMSKRLKPTSQAGTGDARH